jgi:maltooligosyltrehalose trehalohydrolase
LHSEIEDISVSAYTIPTDAPESDGTSEFCMKRSCWMPFGASVCGDASVRFRLWAPKAKRVDILIENSGRVLPLQRIDGGWFELATEEATPGTRYRFQIEGGTKVPDPASRFQPLDVHGPSELVDPRKFDWQDESWLGRPWEEAVIYELHVGTFTPEGTFGGVEQKLDYLRDLGVTAVELMPIADFPGERNWGYDGVLPNAPDSSYGQPDDLKRLIQSAHAKGMMIFLDVVYNHFGPEGNYLHVCAPQFFTKRHHTPWGDAINFDGPESRTVRDFFIWNALYWLEEYHFDGLRLDAVDAIVDDSKPDFLTELAETVREKCGEKRQIHLIVENDANVSHYLERSREGRVQLYNAQWDDDIHHATHVLLTGESDGYYADYSREPTRKLCRCLTEGFAYQGEYSEFHSAQRGEPSAALPPSAFVSFLQNHDQVGNRAFGERIGQLAPPQSVQAAMEILLLAPFPPMLFMGEEFAATTPFLYFCNFHGELASAVTNGRRNEFARFNKFRSPELRDRIPDPNAEQTFLDSKLDWAAIASEPHSGWLKMYRELLSIRRQAVVPLIAHIRNAVIELCDERARVLRVAWLLDNGKQLELTANLSGDSAVFPATPSTPFVYASSAECAKHCEHGSLPPWSVVWRLRS